MATEQRYLGELLARRGVVPPDKLEGLWAVQRERGTELLDLVVNTSVVDEMTLARALAEEAQLPLVERIDPNEVPTALATRVPIAFAKAHKMLVVREDDAAVHVICGDP
ncbi:MAG: type II secretion system protein GspE, partial [Polyangiaceae bacterium]|nr:type II secretion system protein GspE [Polyangiaceae bacterium]